MYTWDYDPNETFETCLSPSVLIARTLYCNTVQLLVNSYILRWKFLQQSHDRQKNRDKYFINKKQYYGKVEVEIIQAQ